MSYIVDLYSIPNLLETEADERYKFFLEQLKTQSDVRLRIWQFGDDKVSERDTKELEINNALARMGSITDTQFRGEGRGRWAVSTIVSQGVKDFGHHAIKDSVLRVEGYQGRLDYKIRIGLLDFKRHMISVTIPRKDQDLLANNANGTKSVDQVLMDFLRKEGVMSKVAQIYGYFTNADSACEDDYAIYIGAFAASMNAIVVALGKQHSWTTSAMEMPNFISLQNQRRGVKLFVRGELASFTNMTEESIVDYFQLAYGECYGAIKGVFRSYSQTNYANWGFIFVPKEKVEEIVLGEHAKQPRNFFVDTCAQNSRDTPSFIKKQAEDPTKLGTPSVKFGGGSATSMDFITAKTEIQRMFHVHERRLAVLVEQIVIRTAVDTANAISMNMGSDSPTFLTCEALRVLPPVSNYEDAFVGLSNEEMSELNVAQTSMASALVVRAKSDQPQRTWTDQLQLNRDKEVSQIRSQMEKQEGELVSMREMMQSMQKKLEKLEDPTDPPSPSPASPTGITKYDFAQIGSVTYTLMKKSDGTVAANIVASDPDDEGDLDISNLWKECKFEDALTNMMAYKPTFLDPTYEGITWRQANPDSFKTVEEEENQPERFAVTALLLVFSGLLPKFHSITQAAGKQKLSLFFTTVEDPPYRVILRHNCSTYTSNRLPSASSTQLIKYLQEGVAPSAAKELDTKEFLDLLRRRLS